jgi:K+-sensing histidine kinase KdpD
LAKETKNAFVWGEGMHFVRTAVPALVALAALLTATAVLWVVRIESVGPQHLVFFYLLPTVFVAVLYGSRLAMLAALAATACAAYFLYDPLYSFSVARPVEAGELLCFVGLALIGAKCTADLLRPAMGLMQNSAAED